VTIRSGTMDDMQDQSTDTTGIGDPAAVAARYGLHRVGTRPHLREYVGQLWSRRKFISVMATSKAYARNQNNYLGQLWSVLNPLILAGVYFLVFGLLLDTRGNIDNFVGFLTIGVFMFGFTSSSLTAGAKSITGNLSLVRALHFPRAVLPVSIALTELATLLPALVVLCGIVLISGETPTWSWLLLPVAVLVQYAFNTGCVFVAARLVVGSRDLLNVIPMGIRLARYVSGVFFPIAYYVGDNPAGVLLEYQPIAVYLELARQCLLDEVPLDPVLWAWGFGWALLFLVVGFVVFWQAEERYGRD
jgi:teichoic acid transport system permease protein